MILRYIVEQAIARGARMAEPGEFTMRAFLNGRLDLTQAEAVRDLIESQTLYQAKVAAQQLQGALSGRLQPIKRRLVELIAVLEAGIDFAEDDVSVLPAPQIMERIAAIRVPLEELAASFAFGRVVHEGITLAIVGRPNVGKSSLFNCLVQRERAIVTPIPGTTRDLVSETIALEGIPVELVDTAGIRVAQDEAESIGIRKSYEAVSEADLILLVLDASQPPTSDDEELEVRLATRPYLKVLNKIDLCHNPAEETGVGTSAKSGVGIDKLRSEILKHVGAEGRMHHERGFLTNLRHKSLVGDAVAGLAAAERAVDDSIPHEMVLMDLYQGLRALDAITGETTADDILNLIFSTFCIGK